MDKRQLLLNFPNQQQLGLVMKLKALADDLISTDKDHTCSGIVFGSTPVYVKDESKVSIRAVSGISGSRVPDNRFGYPNPNFG